jgi:hypothetical protein
MKAGAEVQPFREREVMTRDDELWIAAKEAVCHFWDPENDGKVATRDQVKAICALGWRLMG